MRYSNLTPIYKTREEAREILATKIEGQRRLLADPRAFSTIDPNYLISDAEWRLRWIDCAPEGSNHLCAPMQGKDGVPMSGVYNENLGANLAVREARIARGRHPISGVAV